MQPSTLTRLMLLGILLAGSSSLTAQEAPAAAPEEEEEPAVVRPAESDASSMRLISNYLAASGGRAAHVGLNAVKASGRFKEGRDLRDFEIIETRDGKRLLRLTWRLLGREYEVHRVTDGTSVWKQEILPKEKKPTLVEGTEAERFINHRWFFHPFTEPLADDFVFQYAGSARVGGRPAFLMIGYGRDDVRTWFYFDKETFLVNRYGGVGQIAGREEYFDLVALEFDREDGVLLPERLDFLVQDSTFGYAEFRKIETNPRFDPAIFEKPERAEIWLRQETPSP